MDNNLIINKLDKNVDLPWKLILSADPSREMVESYLLNSDVYVAYLNNKLVGEYILLKHSADVVELINIAVDKDYQGQGIGNKLVHDAINKAKEMEMKSIKVGTGNSSLSQLALYQKCGFRIAGVEKDFFTNNYTEEIIENGITCRDKIVLVLELVN